MSPSLSLTPERARHILEAEAENLEHLSDLRFRVSVELARTEIPLARARTLAVGDVLATGKLAGEDFSVRVNGHPFAVGLIACRGDEMGCRILKVAAPEVSDAVKEARRGLESAAPEAEPAPLPEVPAVATMVAIPAGPFTMGSREGGPDCERPAHTVYLDAYGIGKHPVTNDQYREFVLATGHGAPMHWRGGTYPLGTSNHPVTNVSWEDARAYAGWQGCRLPTEAEWEKAARGDDERHYPWGNRFVEGERCNCANQVGTTTQVNEYPHGRSPYGVWDMAGNVWEWCQDWYAEDYYRVSPAVDPRGPDAGDQRVLRGGGFQEASGQLRTTYRGSAVPKTTCEYTGFRIAVSALKEPSPEQDEGDADA